MRKAALICTASLLLAGCFDLNQSIVINDDRTASYEMNLQMSSALISMLAMQDPGEAQDGDFTSRFCQENKTIDRDVPEGLDLSIKSYFKEDNLVCSYRMSGPLEKFGELDMQGSADQGSGILVNIAVLEDEQVEISSTFDFSDFSEAGESGGDSMEEMASRMMGAMLAGRAMRWSVTAPEVIESNGEISEDGTTATWELPLSVAFAEQERYEFRTVASYAVPWYQSILHTLKFW